jgi:hypothetical protein
MKKGLKEKILEFYKNGMSYNQISVQLNCSKGTISYYLSSLVLDKKAIQKEKKQKLIENIKNNPPENKDIFLERYGEKLTKKEIIMFISNFYKKEGKGLRRGNIPKEYHVKRRKDIKKELVEYKGGCCIVCGYNKSLRSLHFHHLDPSKKDFSISRKWDKLGLNESVKKELDKCVLLCANCHGEVHDGSLKI